MILLDFHWNPHITTLVKYNDLHLTTFYFHYLKVDWFSNVFSWRAKARELNTLWVNPEREGEFQYCHFKTRIASYIYLIFKDTLSFFRRNRGITYLMLFHLYIPYFKIWLDFYEGQIDLYHAVICYEWCFYVN